MLVTQQPSTHPSGHKTQSRTHITSRAVPVTVRDVLERGVEAVGVVGRGTGITAQEFSPILTDATELHVVIFLLLLNALPFLHKMLYSYKEQKCCHC